VTKKTPTFNNNSQLKLLRRKKEEGRRKKEEGRRKREEVSN
jgi:hypothetical protein